MNRTFQNRRGIASAIAMIFLVAMGLMALGFYALTTTAAQLSKNDRRTAKALLAAESGIQFMRNRLAHVTIPPNTSSANLLSELETDLKQRRGDRRQPRRRSRSRASATSSPSR